MSKKKVGWKGDERQSESMMFSSVKWKVLLESVRNNKLLRMTRYIYRWLISQGLSQMKEINDPRVR